MTGTKGLHVPGCAHSIILAESQLLQDLVHSSFGVAACTAAQPTVHIHEVRNLTLLCDKYNLKTEIKKVLETTVSNFASMHGCIVVIEAVRLN